MAVQEEEEVKPKWVRKAKLRKLKVVAPEAQDKRYWPQLGRQMASEGKTLNDFAKAINRSRSYASYLMLPYPDTYRQFLDNAVRQRNFHKEVTGDNLTEEQDALIEAIALLEDQGIPGYKIAEKIGASAMTVSRYKRKYRALIDERRKCLNSMDRLYS